MPTALAAKNKTLRVGCLPPKHTPTRLVFGLQVVTLPPRPANVPTYPCVHGACALGGGTYGSIEIATDLSTLHGTKHTNPGEVSNKAHTAPCYPPPNQVHQARI